MMLGALVVIGAISSAVLEVKGQTQAPQVVQRLDLDVRDILYILTGGGGNTLALMRDDGVVLIESRAAHLNEAEPAEGEPAPASEQDDDVVRLSGKPRKAKRKS